MLYCRHHLQHHSHHLEVSMNFWSFPLVLLSIIWKGLVMRWRLVDECAHSTKALFWRPLLSVAICRRPPALQINIIPLPVTMNRKIKKAPIKLNFGGYNKTTNKISLNDILYVNKCFHQMIALQKLWKIIFISSKKLNSFSRYSNFCIFVFPSFFPCQPLL